MTHYYMTIRNDVARDFYCDIIICHDIVMGTYPDVTMHIDVARNHIYYVLLGNTFIMSVYLAISLQLYIKH